MFKFKNQKANFYFQFCISQRINQNFEIFELGCFAFTALAIDKTFYTAQLFTMQD